MVMMRDGLQNHDFLFVIEIRHLVLYEIERISQTKNKKKKVRKKREKEDTRVFSIIFFFKSY
jgi:hypothetical protein